LSECSDELPASLARIRIACIDGGSLDACNDEKARLTTTAAACTKVSSDWSAQLKHVQQHDSTPPADTTNGENRNTHSRGQPNTGMEGGGESNISSSSARNRQQLNSYSLPAGFEHGASW